MIKSIKQYIKDVCFQLSHSGVDDVIWIYSPILICTVGGFVIGIAIVKALRLVIL